MSTDETTGGLSRRDLIKRSAVAGGLVWAAPTLLAQPAAATTCPTGSCPKYYRFKIDPENGRYGPFPFPTTCPQRVGGFTANFHCPVNNIPAVAVQGNLGPCAALNAAVETWSEPGSPGVGGDGGALVITLKAGYSFIAAFNKKSGNCVAQPLSNNCRTASFEAGASHVEFAICAPS